MSTTGDAERIPSANAKDRTVSLRAVIAARRRLDELGTARLIGEAADAIHKAQTQGQPLGKLSPEAIVVRDGKVVIELPATPTTAYCAPERLRGGSGDRRSDVFSLGAMLWEALAHVRLFEGSNEDAIKNAVFTLEIHPVSQMNANVPAELDAICKKALARDPADRYQSAKVMAAEISAVLDDAGYPEGNEDITKWIAAEFPVSAKQPTQPPPAHRTITGNATVTGMAPLKVEEAKAKVEEAKATLADKLAAAAPKPAGAAPAPKPITAAPPNKPIVAAPAPAPAPAKVATPATKPVNDKTMPLSVMDIEVVPLETKKSDAKPFNDTLVDAKPLGSLPAKPGATTLTGMSSSMILPAQSAPILLTQPKPPADPPAPSPSMLAGAPPITPAVISTMPGVTPPVSSQPGIKLPGVTPMAAVQPALKLPDAPPGATISANTPSALNPTTIPPANVAIGATTAILGSNASLPATAPAQYAGSKTAVLGSNAIIEATNAAVSAANPPVQPAAPILPKELPAPFKSPAKPISQAETLATPTLIPQSAAVPAAVVVTPSLAVATTVKATAETPTIPVHSVSSIEPGKAAANLPPASDDDFASSPAVPASPIVAQGKPRGDKTGPTGKADVLAGWGWGTDSHEALTTYDDPYEEDRKRAKKRLVIAIGGAVGVVLVLVVIGFAFSGGDKPSEEGVAKPAVADPMQLPPEPPKAEPVAEAPKTEPVVEPPKTEPAPEPPKTEPAVEPPKTEPAALPPTTEPKPEPTPDPDPPKIAKVDPKPEPKVEPKKDPPKIAKDPPKKDPPKVPPKKDPPKKDPPKIARELPKKDPPKKDPPKKDPPKKDPPEPTPLKLDAAAAYKTGLQQFAKGDSGGALQTFKASLATDPGFAPTWRGIGLVYEKLGKKSQASTAFKRYLQLSPNAGDAEQIRTRLERL